MQQPIHLISTENITADMLYKYIASADTMYVSDRYGYREHEYKERNKNKILGLLFYEPSTRTSCSFQAAMAKLGGSFIVVNTAFSSTQKGETLEDTIRSMGCYCDAIVLRHPEKGSSQRSASVSWKPIINGGDGDGEHPTQALMDMYTIYKEIGHVDDITVTFMGDLKYSRTIHSLIHLLSLYNNVSFIYVSPPGLELPAELQQQLDDKKVPQIKSLSIEDAISVTDVLYVTRIQKERFQESDSSVVVPYIIDANIMKRAKQNMIVMHPLPRNEEISTDVDTDPRAAYFRQMEYGVYMRMAILDSILNQQ